MIAGAMCGGAALRVGLLAAGMGTRGADSVSVAREMLKTHLEDDDMRNRFENNRARMQFIFDLLTAFDENLSRLKSESHTITLLLNDECPMCVCVPSGTLFSDGSIGLVTHGAGPKHTIKVSLSCSAHTAARSKTRATDSEGGYGGG